jgi:hypothetical protein
MKPICVGCQRFYRLKISGFHFTEAMPTSGETPATPGTAEPERWQPYKLWVGDLWRCQGCGHLLVSGVAMLPISEHYQDDFAELSLMAQFRQLQVNDC